MVTDLGAARAREGSFDDPGTPLSQVTFVVVDVETTGGSPASSSLTEVAAARYRGGERIGTYQTLVRPDGPIPPFITALTGISDAMVADAPRAGEMLPSLLEFVGGAVLVGHNLRFDLSFIDHALASTGREGLANATVDTLALARRLVRDTVPDCKLGTLASHLRLPHRPSHRALTDVLATADLLHAMLERAGPYGILALGELHDLPRLVGHPQSGKLLLTSGLPHRPGVYWFTDAAGHVLHVGKATDIREQVRSYFAAGDRRRTGRLLRQLHAVHHRVCPGPLTASVLEGRLVRRWSPPFDRPTVPRRRGRRRVRDVEELDGDPTALLRPLGVEAAELSRRRRYEDAASVRDEAERLRKLLVGHRRTESLRRAGLTVLSIEGEGTVTLGGGLLIGADSASDSVSGWGSPPVPTVDHCDEERLIVAQWLHANAHRVRIIEVESPQGLIMPAVRIPRLAELCRRPNVDRVDSAA